MTMHKHERLAQLIGRQTPVKEALAIVGMSPAYYARLKDTEEFTTLLQIEVNSDKIEGDTKAIAEKKLVDHSTGDEYEIREDSWSALEARTLQAAMAQVNTAELKDVNKTLDILSRRRASNKNADAAMLAAKNGPQQTLVMLNLPEYQRNEILVDNLVTTNEGEVIQAGERALTPMSTDSVLDMLEAHNPNREITIEDL